MAGFPNVIGCVDVTHVTLQAPVINEHEYVNRSGRHSINVQLICDAELRILNCVVNYPGSVHDARILREGAVWRALEQNVVIKTCVVYLCIDLSTTYSNT